MHNIPQVAMLKVKLGAFGWNEAVRRERRQARAVTAAAAGGGEMAAELSDYLGRMGGGVLSCQGLRRLLPAVRGSNLQHFLPHAHD